MNKNYLLIFRNDWATRIALAHICFGVAFCVGLGIRYALVPPKTWQKALFPIHEGKDSAIAYVENKYHDVDLVLPRCRKPHDGMADAICIADYGLSIECTK